jgi:hypothetical protein
MIRPTALSPRAFSLVALVAAMLFAPLAVRAEPSAPLPAAALVRVDAFLAQLKAGKVAAGYDKAFAGTLMSKKQADLEQMVAQTETALKYYGAVRDWQPMGQTHAAPGFATASYLVRTENAPMFMRFQLYDNGDHWIVYLIQLTDTYDQTSTW